MGKVKGVVLSDSERVALEKGARDGTPFAYRKRCQMILLKAANRPSKEVASEVGGCAVVVNTWLKRYQQQGIAGLRTLPGQGRRAILQTDADLEVVRRAVAAHRQKVSLAHAELQADLGKTFSPLTLKRFLKKTVAATNALDG